MSKLTQKFHEHNLNKVFEILKNKEFKEKSFPNVNELVKRLEEFKNYKIRTISNYLSSVIKYLKEEKYPDDFIKAYLQKRKEIQYDINKMVLENKADDEIKNIKWDDIIKFRKELPVGTLNNLLLSLFTLIPTRRISDYSNMLVYKKYKPFMETDTDNNYYCIENFTMYFNKYKTFRFYGHYKFQLNKDNKDEKTLIINIETFLKNQNMKKEDDKKKATIDGTYILGNKYTPNAITKKVIKLLTDKFKTDFGGSMLRHMYITNFYSRPMNEISTAEIINLSKRMGHSVEEQLKYRNN